MSETNYRGEDARWLYHFLSSNPTASKKYAINYKYEAVVHGPPSGAIEHQKITITPAKGFSGLDKLLQDSHEWRKKVDHNLTYHFVAEALLKK